VNLMQGLKDGLSVISREPNVVSGVVQIITAVAQLAANEIGQRAGNGTAVNKVALREPNR